jgi:hypothetical protein
MGRPPASVAATRSAVSCLKAAFCARRCRGVDARVEGRAVLRGQFLVVRPGILAGDGGDLGRQQAEDDAVLVGRPHRAVTAQEGRAGALLATEAEAAVEQARREPLEAHRHLEHGCAPARRPPDRSGRWTPASCPPPRAGPLRPVGQQVMDRHGEKWFGFISPSRGRDDAVPVHVRVVAPGDVEAVLQLRPGWPSRSGLEQSMRILPSWSSVMKANAGSTLSGHHLDVQAVFLGDRLPVGHRGAAQRIDADLQPGARIAAMSITFSRSAT